MLNTMDSSHDGHDHDYDFSLSCSKCKSEWLDDREMAYASIGEPNAFCLAVDDWYAMLDSDDAGV